MVSSYVTIERVDCGQANIAGRDSVLTCFFQIGKKGNHVVRFDTVEVQILNSTLSFRCHETKKEHQTVPVAVNGVRTHATDSWQMICKVTSQPKGKLVS